MFPQGIINPFMIGDKMEFTINRKSWHYKLNSLLRDKYDMEVWEYRHKNFCKYWRATLFRVISFLIVSTSLSSILYYFVLSVVNNPIILFNIMMLVGVFLAITAFFTFILYVVIKFRNIRQAKARLAHEEYVPKYLIMQKIYVLKRKICPHLNFKD